LAAIGATVLAAHLVAARRPAEAHPHVWVAVIAELIYGPAGSVSGVREAWTFDDMFSAFSTRGIEQKTQGAFSREELAPVAKTYIEALKDFGYFTYAKLDGEKRPDAFADPADYFFDYEPNKSLLTLHFTLAFKTPVPSKSLDVQIFDPQLFFYLAFAKDDPVRLVGGPARCVSSVKKLDEATPETGSIAGTVTTSTATIWVTCP
jgi:ABC-type uncharacterized transport system substrate-binding protein